MPRFTGLEGGRHVSRSASEKSRLQKKNPTRRKKRTNVSRHGLGKLCTIDLVNKRGAWTKSGAPYNWKSSRQEKGVTGGSL